MGKSEIDLDNLEYNGALWLNKYRSSVAPKTTLRRITTLRNLGKAFGMRILEDYTGPKPKKTLPHPLPGGKSDLEKLIRVARNDEEIALVALTGYCGLRVGESRDIGPNEFVFPKRSLRFVGKGSQEREVPCSPRAWDILFPFAAEAKLYDKPKLITCCDKTARSAITDMGQRAKLSRNISSHDLRATFATEAYRRTKDIRAVQLLLGHSSVAQTQIYILTDESDMRNAASFAEDYWEDWEDDDEYF